MYLPQGSMQGELGGRAVGGLSGDPDGPNTLQVHGVLDFLDYRGRISSLVSQHLARNPEIQRQWPGVLG